MPKFSVKRPYTVLVAVVALLVLGVVTFTKLSTDLLPEMELPYMIVVTVYPGASPERVESQVTSMVEANLGTINGVVNITSSSNENYSMVMLEFAEGTNMDGAKVDLATAIDQMTLPENVSKPILMEVSMDMMPTLIATIDREDMDIYELSDYAEETVVPYLERQDGVASVNGMGLVDEYIEVRLEQDEIDELNDKLAAYVDENLGDAKAKLDDAQREINNAQGQLSSGKQTLQDQQTSTVDELANASQMLDEVMATRAAYSAQVTGLKASQQALQAEQKAYQDAGVEENYAQINNGLTSIYTAMLNVASDPTSAAALAAMGITIDVTKLPLDVEDAAAHPEKVTYLKNLVTQLSAVPVMGQQFAAMAPMLDALEPDALTALQTAHERIAAVGDELNNLTVEIAAAEAVLENVNSATQEAANNYSTMEAGKITAAAGFGSAAAQLDAAQTALDNGKKELESGMESYDKAKETALKNANLDQLLNMDTLSNLIMAQNFAMPAGYIHQDETQYLLKVGDEFTSMEDLENALLADIDGVGKIRLKDIATVTMLDTAGENYAKVNGNDAIILTIYKASTSGTSDVSKTCNKALENLCEETPELRTVNLMDQGEYIGMIVKNVLQNLIVGALLAVIVLAIFLKDPKPTIVVAFAIPLSVLFAMVLMYFTNITMNIISLSGLGLGVGMLVDNSIVVVENIYRLRNKGVPAARAAVMGANQVAGAIFASTLTTICVFFPIVFATGLAKQIFPDMAFTIAYSLGASLIVALTVVPSMSATVLKNTKPKEHRWFDAIIRVYEKTLRFCLRFKFVPLLIAVSLLAFSVVIALRTGLILIPEMGSEQMSLEITTDAENSDEENFAIADDVLEKLQEVEEINTVGVMTSASTNLLGSFGGSGATNSFYYYILLNEGEGDNNKEVGKKIEAAIADCEITDYTVTLSNMDMSSLMGSGMAINIYGSDLDTMLDVSEDVKQILEDVGGMEEITNGQEEGDPELKIVVNKDKAMQHSLTVAQVFAEISKRLVTEDTSTTLTMQGKDYEVKVVDENDVPDRASVMDQEFTVTTTDKDGNQQEEIHKLSEFATLQEGKSVNSVNRENQQRYITVSATTMEGYNTSLLARDVADRLDEYQAPDGITIEIGGESEQINDVLKDMMLLMLLAIILIYLVMVAQFQNLVSPMIVMLTIPLAFTGGFLAILISGEEISLVALMGFLVLSGVIVNNGIVFVDYVNQLRIGGMAKKEAICETGKTRMRPILMTALTTILAMSTMAFSKDAAAAMGKGMALVIIGGLLYGTLMTLYIVPIFYDIIYRREELKVVDIGDESTLKDEEERLAEGASDVVKEAYADPEQIRSASEHEDLD